MRLCTLYPSPQAAQAKLQESKDAKKKAAEEAGQEEDDDL
jgi:hypothetical protein